MAHLKGNSCPVPTPPHPPFFLDRCTVSQGGTCLSCLLTFTDIRTVPTLPSKKDIKFSLNKLLHTDYVNNKSSSHLSLEVPVTPTRN